MAANIAEAPLPDSAFVPSTPTGEKKSLQAVQIYKVQIEDQVCQSSADEE